jgi:hypothetical protein
MNLSHNLLAFVGTRPIQTALLVLGIYAVFTVVVTVALKTVAARGEAFDAALESTLSQSRREGVNRRAEEPAVGEPARNLEFVEA